MDVPHSGNICSGLCRQPCGHIDCWQCEEYQMLNPKSRPVQPPMNMKSKPGQKIVRPIATTLDELGSSTITEEMVKEVSERLAKSAAKTMEDHVAQIISTQGHVSRIVSKGVIPPANSNPGAELKDTTTITRLALEGLAARANVTIDWNNGSPIFHEQTRAVPINRLTSSDVLTPEMIERAAHQLGVRPTTYFNDEVRRIVASMLNEEVTAMNAAHEAKARDLLRQQGVSDDDIDAATALLGEVPKPKPAPPKDRLSFMEPEKVLAAWKAQLDKPIKFDVYRNIAIVGDV